MPLRKVLAEVTDLGPVEKLLAPADRVDAALVADQVVAWAAADQFRILYPSTAAEYSAAVFLYTDASFDLQKAIPNWLRPARLINLPPTRTLGFS